MTITYFSPVLLRACLVRRGVWLVEAETSRPTDFYHRCCWAGKDRPMPDFVTVSKEKTFEEMQKFIGGEPSMFVGCPTGDEDVET